MSASRKDVSKEGAWVRSPGIKGLDRPWLRKRNGRWTITYGKSILICDSEADLTSTYRLAYLMVTIED